MSGGLHTIVLTDIYSTARAQSSLASILLRLNAGFVSMIGKLIRREITRSDYKKLVDLSNSSRDEAIDAFEQLSGRLSQSVGALLGRKKNQPRASGKSAGPKASPSRRSMTSSPVHSRPKRASESSVGKTILGPSAPQGWASPRGERSASTKPNSLQAPSHSRLRAPAKSKPRSHAGSQKSKAKSSSTALPTQARHPLISPSPYVSTSRISLVSFASDSTKLGEIPDRKWPAGNDDDVRKACPNGTALPLTPSGEDELKKPRSRFLRLFRK